MSVQSDFLEQVLFIEDEDVTHFKGDPGYYHDQAVILEKRLIVFRCPCCGDANMYPIPQSRDDFCDVVGAVFFG